MKKVLFIITKSNFGGAQRYVYDLATNIPSDLYTVRVALGGTGEKEAKTGTLKEKLERSGIPVIPVTNFMRNMSLISDIRVFFELMSIVRKERPDVLHVTSSKAGGIGAFVGRLLRVKKIIFTSHGLAYDENWRPRWQRMFIWVASWCTFLFSTKTIQITNDTYERAGGMPFMKNKMVLVHNGRERATLLSKDESRQILCKHENVCGETWVGTIAELTPNKNLDILIEAFSYIHKENRHPHLWIVGEGEERGRLEKIVKKHSLEQHVHMPGYVNNASTLLNAFDIFTLTSKKEGLPYVLLEAGLASLPVIVSDIPGISDIVSHGRTGIAYEPHNVTAIHLATSISRLIEDEKLRKKYGNALHEYVTENFSISKMVEETLKQY